MQQLDLFEQVKKEEREVKQAAEQKAIRRRIAERIVREKNAIGMEDFERIKAERAIQIEPNELPWKPLNLFPDYEKCNVLAVIPPSALDSLEFRRRTGKSVFQDPVGEFCFDLWGKYNWCIWNYKPHGVDWCKAWDILKKHRETGEPVWMQLSRTYGRIDFLPECIVEVTQ